MYINVEGYLNTAIPVDIIDYLLFLAGSVSDELETDGKGFWDRVTGLFEGWSVEGGSLGLPGGLVGLDLKRSLKGGPDLPGAASRRCCGPLGSARRRGPGLLAESLRRG